MADALVSPAVAGVAGIGAASLIAVAARKVREIGRDDIIPLMGVMGAFVFAAQMINFSIPGTGSSGHIVGGVLLAAVVGPWAAFFTLCSVLMVQCLIFADGGLLALGCNILNMAATSCLLGYTLAYRPIANGDLRPWRLMTAAITASVVALELGALGVTAETELSGITALPPMVFLSFMLPIHLVIGAIEGMATGAVICFLAKYRPTTLYVPADPADSTSGRSRGVKSILSIFIVLTILLAAGFSWLASGDPDGLEWSIGKTAPALEVSSVALPTTVLPDYDSSFAGIIGAALVMIMLWAVSSILFRSLRSVRQRVRSKK